MAIGVIIISVLFIAAFIFLVLIYNRFIQGKNFVAEAWSGIDVQLKRRHDLIPNLIETVKGYMQHEKTLLSDIAGLRSQGINAGDVKALADTEGALTRALRTLFAVAESYPDLKANQNFMDLQKALAEIEENLQLARRYYNGTVRDFNIRVEAFPGNLVARFFGFTLFEFFEIEDEAERKVPEVKFS